MSYSNFYVPTGKEYLLNLEKKLNDRLFVSDTEGILRPDINYVPAQAFEIVKRIFVMKI